MPFWTKEREAGIWDFRGKVGNSQDENQQILGKQTLARSLGNNRMQNKV